MIDTYPTTLVAMEIYRTGSYVVPWSSVRWNIYQGAWTPFSCHDGLYDAWPIGDYETNFLARQAIPTDVTIDMVVFGSSPTFDVYATVCVEPTGTGKTMNIWMAQVVDHYGEPNFDRNMARDGTAGVEVTLAPAECTTVVETFVLDSVSQATPENVKFFSWAQDTNFVYDPQVQNIGGTWYGSWFGEIFQGAKALPPFEGVFVDNFEDGTTDAWSLVMP